MMNLAEYRRTAQQPRRLPALGGAGRRGRRPQQGRLVPAHGAVSRPRPRQSRRRPSSSRITGAAQQRAAPAGLRLGDLRRGAARARQPLSARATFPIAVSRLVDAERRAQFEEEGAHFESRYFLTLRLAAAGRRRRARREPGSTRAARATGADWRAALAGFIDRTDRVLALIEGFMPEADWLDDAETLTYLHSCVSTKRQRVRVPETPMHLDAILADEDLTGGLEPRLGRAHLRTLTIMGFPSQTWPGLLDDLNRLAFPYRWSTRAICLDKTDATKVLDQHPPAMVRQAQIDHGDPQGGDDQRGLGR